VEKEVGKGYGKLLQLYGVHKATIEPRKKGFCSSPAATEWRNQTRSHRGINE
jgi:hypothetical protein